MKKVRVKREDLDVQPGYMGTFADMFCLLMAFFVLLYSTADPDPVILAKTAFGKLARKFFKLLILGYFLNTIFSRSLFDLIKLAILKKLLFFL